MNMRLFLVFGAVLGLTLLVWWLRDRAEEGQGAGMIAVEEASLVPGEEEIRGTEPVVEEQVMVEEVERAAAGLDLTPRSAPLPLGAPLLASEVAARWMELEGYTREDIEEAQDHLRAQGMSDGEVEDPGNVRRLLPPRHVSSLVPTGLVISDRAAAGEPIPFVLEGRMPDPSFTFTRFVIQQQGPVILVRANGHSDGHMVAAFEGEGDPLLLEGELPPLEPGAYRVELLELGPHGIFPLTVVEAGGE
ncbi:MAG TPA: hypothetical protein PKE55_04480 [Kiritimatiellia bacterium]|mgnify:CR=1 FL=1|nr:hypothetical protein [Kiritimatiellia bacterium]